MARRTDPEKQPPIPCWYCWRPIPVARILRDGIILGREEERGGPERLLICPSCLKENLCEETPRGRWFASPRIAIGLLDLLFSKLPGGTTEEILQAISWYRENEERRRFFFLRDGDRRYGGTSFLDKLWPWSKPVKPARPARPKPAPEGSREGPRTPPPAAERPRVVTPWEILGIPAGASREEVRRAFHRLAVRYHPDKVHHLGEEFQAMAHVKFQELKRAYDALIAESGSGHPP
jgi:DnaJ-domain-containing protein 1